MYFLAGKTKSRVFIVDKAHIQKLKNFSDQFGMVPVFALLVCLSDEHLIHLIIMPVDELKKYLPEVKHGYSIRFSTEQRKELIAKPFVDSTGLKYGKEEYQTRPIP